MTGIGRNMLYPFYELNHAYLQPLRVFTNAGLAFWQGSSHPLAKTASASLSMFERATRRYEKPSFGIANAEEQIVWRSPFCDLIRFKTKDSDSKSKLLMVAPMSGHFATLLRGTVTEMLSDYDVYVTDWMDARNVPVEAGTFDLEDYTDLIIDILHHLKTPAHVMAVCQPSVPVMVAVSVMSANHDPLVPHSMTLMGGPIDTRLSPTAVNKLAEDKGLNWFRDNMIMKVSGPHKGAGRSVYAGFMQLTGFLAMNATRHLKAHRDLFRAKLEGDKANETRHETFYDEYMAVMDLTAEFYLQTIDRVFIHHDLPCGTYLHRGEMIDPSVIVKTALMTIEGERDDISGLGQTEAAHALCPNIPASKKQHHLQMGVGHYGVFSGSKFSTEIAPKLKAFLVANEV